MSLIKSSLKNDSNTWAAYNRYRVNDVVFSGGETFQNKTGINSVPSSSSPDWVKISSKSTATITVNGNTFNLKKHPQNNVIVNQETLEVNDIASNGFWDNTEFWAAAIYLGGDKDVKSNWNPLLFVEEIPLN